MSSMDVPAVIKKEVIDRWFGSNKSANSIAEELNLSVGTVLAVIQESRGKKIQTPQITDDKIPFDKVELSK